MPCQHNVCVNPGEAAKRFNVLRFVEVNRTVPPEISSHQGTDHVTACGNFPVCQGEKPCGTSPGMSRQVHGRKGYSTDLEVVTVRDNAVHFTGGNGLWYRKPQQRSSPEATALVVSR